MLDLEAIKGRLAKASEPGNPWRDSWAIRDIAALVAEVERLREEAEQQKWALMSERDKMARRVETARGYVAVCTWETYRDGEFQGICANERPCPKHDKPRTPKGPSPAGDTR
jgi:hypothetical protein